jgi:hypothetical protein
VKDDDMGGACYMHGEGIRNACKILVGNPEGTDHSEDRGSDGKIILKWAIKKNVVRCGLDLVCKAQGPVGNSCERGEFLKS